MKKAAISLLLLALMLPYVATPFCGFYVAKADAKLFNKSSQVIYVRNGIHSTITMANDYEGPLEDFAMVVPVPVVLREHEIRIAKSDLFEKFDSYSAPRLAVYYDENPCARYIYENEDSFSNLKSTAVADFAYSANAEKEYKVTIEAQYEVGEYDILILSAKESDGLERWLTDNGYKIPDQAKEVLTPYIRDNMKFFVAKVSADRMELKNSKFLSPIQINFPSERFMLPIRLGMANANGDQDMIVYMLTENGRVEAANYRNTKIPSNQNIPLFVRDNFSSFYKKLFDKHYQENQTAVHLEYSWDISSSNYVKCDPCNSTPPSAQELINAGVNWLQPQRNNWGGSDYQGNIHFTRLHVRYNRANFPQDLVFTQTSNKQNYQGRYVLHQPAQINSDCEQLNDYYLMVTDRRYDELANYKALTGESLSAHLNYVKEYESKLDARTKRNDLMPIIFDIKNGFPLLIFLVSIITFISFSIFQNRQKQNID